MILRLLRHTEWGQLLDLRRSAFRSDEKGALFAPASGAVRVVPAVDAADLFLLHFGAGDQSAVRFEMAHFTRSFHDVFVRCREHGIALHGNFVALGIHLAALYEHLEALGVELDVRAAFRATQPTGAP